MARLADPKLIFDGGCPDCGERVASLPLPIPGVEDDFDWATRDYDSFRLFMMQELASRFPQRRRWTAADMEVVLVEVLAAALDRASHALDRVQAERFLDSARRPESVRRLLKLIGYDATLHMDQTLLAERPEATPEARVEGFWRENPMAMEAARAAGPRLIAQQNRMVTLADHAEALQAHPLVALARARLVSNGAWPTIFVSVLLEDDKALDAPLHQGAAEAVPNQVRREIWAQVLRYHTARNLPLPNVDDRLTGRRILRALIEDYRMIGTEVLLEAAKPAAINITLSIRAQPGFFRSELKQALAQVFSTDEGRFFETGRLDFGAALYASDVIEAAMAVDGVAVACLNLFRRVGKGFEDQSADGVITVTEDEFIQCRSERSKPQSGMLRIVVNGGEAG
ncbi:hypothetical protein J7413_14440 [Shimia sp. R10_1]|uniref:hypothetical protein n=1 Tax=Shimia sp. R10_1 TaxID=2821095 RepID=UPI001ADCAEEB|nr:hypothetical protein [Shimia sp. R10_1]MBO9474745.1 hypothetical protein [Shimia sp. R10_1]